MQYRPEIDGLRSIAVVPVILFHAGLSVFSGGFVGVDVFFVISGYLITGIILRDLERGRFSILQFYERRARRILPALFLVMAVSIPLAWAVMMPFPFRNFSQSLVAVSLSASNILFWLEAGYFDTESELKPMLHTWSLAVEEQFYILLPPLMMLLGAAVWRRLVGVLAALAVASFVLTLWMVQVAPSAAFFLLPTRAWELLVGSLCALVLARQATQLQNNWGALAGLGLILWSVFALDGDVAFPSAWTLPPVVGTALIILYAGPSTWVGRCLSLAPFVWIGLISYSAYLWHQPVFAFARLSSLGKPDLSVMLGLAVLSLGLAWLTWRFVEQPFRSRPRPDGSGMSRPLLPRRSTLLTVSGAMIAGFVVLGLVGSETRLHTVSWRTAQSPETLDVYDMLGRADRARTREANTRTASDGQGCTFRLSTGSEVTSARTRMERCAEAHGPALVVLGDSHAGDLYLLLARGDVAPFLVGITSGGCRAHAPASGCPYDAFAEFLAVSPDLVGTVLFEQAGFYLMHNGHGGDGDRHMFTSHAPHQAIPGFTPHTRFIARNIAYLDRLLPYSQVVWIGPRPDPHVSPEMAIRLGCAAPIAMRPGQKSAYDALNRAILEALEGRAITFIDQIEALDLHLPEDLMSCDAMYWIDGDHFSLDGMDRFTPRLLPALRAVVSAS